MKSFLSTGIKAFFTGKKGLESSGVVYGYLYNGFVVNEEISSSPDWGFLTGNRYDYLFTCISDLTTNDWDGASGTFSNHLKGLRVEPDAHPRWNYDATHIPLDTVNLSLYPGGRRSGLNGSFNNIGSGAFVLLETNEKIAISLFSMDQYFESNVNNNWGHSVRLSRLATPEESASLSTGDYGPDYIGNDGKVYRTVYFETDDDNLIVMAENLAETKYRNGSDIPIVTDSEDWIALTSGARCAYNNDESYV